MSDIILKTLPGSFPAGYCPASTQQLANDIAAGQRVLFPSELSIGIESPNEPGVEDRDKIWFKIDSSTNIVTGRFTWSPSYGAWLQDHWFGRGVPTDERRIFVGSSGDVDYFDGGEPGTVSDTTGPFWAIDTDFADHWPLGVGSTIGTVGSDLVVFDVGTPAAPKGIGVYFLKPSGRLFDRGS